MTQRSEVNGQSFRANPSPIWSDPKGIGTLGYAECPQDDGCCLKAFLSLVPKARCSCWPMIPVHHSPCPGRPLSPFLLDRFEQNPVCLQDGLIGGDPAFQTFLIHQGPPARIGVVHAQQG